MVLLIATVVILVSSIETRSIPQQKHWIDQKLSQLDQGEGSTEFRDSVGAPFYFYRLPHYSVAADMIAHVTAHVTE